MGQPYWANRQDEETGQKSGVRVSINGRAIDRVFANRGKAVDYLERQGYTKEEIRKAKFSNT